MNFKSLAATAAHMAEQLAVAVVPGAGPAIELGEKLLEFGKALKPHVPDGQEATDLTVNLAKLEASVMQHADRTINSLGDGPT